MMFKLRLWDVEGPNMESVWAEETETPNRARLLNQPFMFPELERGSVVDWRYGEEDHMPVSPQHGKGVVGAERQRRIDKVWNGE